MLLSCFSLCWGKQASFQGLGWRSTHKPEQRPVSSLAHDSYLASPAAVWVLRRQIYLQGQSGYFLIPWNQMSSCDQEQVHRAMGASPCQAVPLQESLKSWASRQNWIQSLDKILSTTTDQLESRNLIGYHLERFLLGRSGVAPVANRLGSAQTLSCSCGIVLTYSLLKIIMI